MLINIALNYGLKDSQLKRKQFNSESWCISDLYFKCLGKYISGVFRKIVVKVVDEGSHTKDVEDLVDVIVIYSTLDFDRYFKLVDKYLKKKTLLNILHRAFMELATYNGWNIDSLLDAYNCCLGKNLNNEWLRENRYFLSNDRKYYGGVYCNWDVDKFEAFAIFLNKQKEQIRKIKLYEKEPWDVDPMGRMGWDKDTGMFYLLSKDGKQKWTAHP